MDSGLTVAALLLVASFAIDRVVSGLLFLLSFFPPWRSAFPEPQLLTKSAEKYRARKVQKLLYFSLSAVAAVVLVAKFPDFMVLKKLGFAISGGLEFWDQAFTIIALIGGADRIADLADSPGTAGKTQSEPLEITGTVTLIESNGDTGHAGR